MNELWFSNRLPRSLLRRGIAGGWLIVVCVTVVGSASLLFVAPGTSQERPLSLNEVVQLLENQVTDRRIADLIKKYGIDFQDATLARDRLIRAGASEIVLGAVRASEEDSQGNAQPEGLPSVTPPEERPERWKIERDGATRVE